MYNRPLSEFVGAMTDEFGGSYIKEYVSNGPNNYAYRTGDGIRVVKIKGFILNFVAFQQLTFDLIKEMAISEQEEHIIVTESRKISKDPKRRQINTLPFSKLYRIIFDNSQLHQFIVRICVIIIYTYYLVVQLESSIVCVCVWFILIFCITL